MNIDDFDDFCSVVVGFAELRGKQLSAPALELYFRSMRSWSLEDFKQAAQHLLGTSQFFPTPYDFEQLRRAGQPTAGEAWAEVLSGAQLAPGSLADRAARIVGGQLVVRHANVEKDLPHIQRRFMDAYEELSEVAPVREALPQITNAGRSLIGNLKMKQLT